VRGLRAGAWCVNDPVVLPPLLILDPPGPDADFFLFAVLVYNELSALVVERFEVWDRPGPQLRPLPAVGFAVCDLADLRRAAGHLSHLVFASRKRRCSARRRPFRRRRNVVIFRSRRAAAAVDAVHAAFPELGNVGNRIDGTIIVFDV
jgi:hypothetical protein